MTIETDYVKHKQKFEALEFKQANCNGSEYILNHQHLLNFILQQCYVSLGPHGHNKMVCKLTAVQLEHFEQM